MRGYSLPKTFEQEISEFEEIVESYRKGSISSAELKARRVPFGIYEQREKDVYMMRIRCGGGFISPVQLARISELAEQYGKAEVHLTTRQEIQVHEIDLADFIPLVRALKEIGMSSQGGGGNTVRNIIAPADAGVDPEEVFDVSPYAIALTTRLITEEDSWTLPRKLKISFSGSVQDKGHATVTDIGFIAKIKSGERGFKVYIAGGMGASSRTATPLTDFIKAEEVYNLVKAVKTLFWKYGNRKNKKKARLRFLWEELKEETFRRLLKEEYEKVLKEKHPPLRIRENPQVEARPKSVEYKNAKKREGFELWKKRYVRNQRQEEVFSVAVPVRLGLIGSRQARILAEFLLPLGENALRVTTDQNFFIRNIPLEMLPAVHSLLKDNIEEVGRPFILENMISCAGASTCQLGLCLSRALAEAIKNVLMRSDIDLDELADLRINISGCPNSCGQHLLAHVGFFGQAGRKNGKLYPAYTVVAGARVKDGEAEFAEILGKISARNVPLLLESFLSAYVQKKAAYSDFTEYFAEEGKKTMLGLIERYEYVPPFEEDKNYYFDWGSDEVFSLASRGFGECSAGIFDLIQLDLNNMKEVRKELAGVKGKEKEKKLLKDLVFYSARALLITRGEEPGEEKNVYSAFRRHFLEKGLVPEELDVLLRYAEKNEMDRLLKSASRVYALAEKIEVLYEKMDNSFNFEPEEKKNTASGIDKKDLIREHERLTVKDLRGVACPMNFVQTKMELEKIENGELLEVWLDDGEPVENVPGSVREEGHEVVKQEKQSGYWKVRIRKG